MPRPEKQEAAKTGRKSNSKGKRGERYARDYFKQHGFNAHRGRQYSGDADAPDVVTDIDWLHTEVKFVERLNLAQAFEQATRDATSTNPITGEQHKLVPMVFHKRNGKEPLVTLTAHDFLGLVELVESYREDPYSGIKDRDFLLERIRRTEKYFGNPGSDEKTVREEKIAEIEDRLKDRAEIISRRRFERKSEPDIFS